MKRALTQWLVTFGLYTGDMVFYLWDLLPAVYLSQPELFEVQPFRLASTLAEMNQGLLVETQDSTAPLIMLANNIRDPLAFFAELNRGWRSASENFTL
jgi:hypothetical protein